VPVRRGSTTSRTRVSGAFTSAYTKRAVQPIDVQPRLYERNGHVGGTYKRLSDAELVRKATGGDSRALDALLERHAPKVNRLAAQLVGDFEDARDAAQESLVKVCTRLRQFRGEAQFATWLHRLVVNTCRDRMAFQRVRRTKIATRRAWPPSPICGGTLPRRLRGSRPSNARSLSSAIRSASRTRRSRALPRFPLEPPSATCIAPAPA
jgi:RNA polymerase sigma factor (sigma-70 family)